LNEGSPGLLGAPGIMTMGLWPFEDTGIGGGAGDGAGAAGGAFGCIGSI